MKGRERRRLGLALGLTVAIFLFCLCWRYQAMYYAEKFIPGTYARALWLALRLGFARLLHTAEASQADARIATFGSVLYYGALAQLKLTAMAFLAGAGLAVAGAIFQTAYQNPMASPNILGATAGVRLGNVLVVMLYSVQAYDHIILRYKFCYGFTIACVALVLLLGRLADTRGEYSILEMVMAGSIVSQALNVLTMYWMYNLAEEDLLLYQQITMGTYLDTGTLSTLLFFGVMLVALCPIVLLRYRLNALGMTMAEAYTAGISVGALRLVAQICGVMMVTCAMIHCGEAGMLTMVVPYTVRQLVGADFRKVCCYSILAGGSLMMLCRLGASFFLIAGEAIPVTFFINLILMPAFMVILARQKGLHT